MKKSVKSLALSMILVSIISTNTHAIELGKLTNNNLNNNLIKPMAVTCCNNMRNSYYYSEIFHNTNARPSSNLNCNVKQTKTEYCTNCNTRKATTPHQDYYHFHK